MRVRLFTFLCLIAGCFGQVLACSTFCQNCKITQIEPHITGSTVFYFNKPAANNSDNCSYTGSVIIDADQEGSKELYSSMLAAFLNDNEFSYVRTCGCKVEWGTERPSIGWVRILP